MTKFEQIRVLRDKGYTDHMIAKILKLPLEVVKSVKRF